LLFHSCQPELDILADHDGRGLENFDLMERAQGCMGGEGDEVLIALILCGAR
jgi:hypothetical protein